MDPHNPDSQFDEFHQALESQQPTEESFGYDLFGFDLDTEVIDEHFVRPIKLPMSARLVVSEDTKEALANAYKMLSAELADQPFQATKPETEAQVIRFRIYRQGMQAAVQAILNRIVVEK